MSLPRVKYGLDVFTTEKTVEKLQQFFQNVTGVPTAETQLCGFKRSHREIRAEVKRIQSRFVQAELLRRKAGNIGGQGEGKSEDLSAIIHSEGQYRLGRSRVIIVKSLVTIYTDLYSKLMYKYDDPLSDLNISRALNSGPSFPWESFTSNIQARIT